MQTLEHQLSTRSLYARTGLRALVCMLRWCTCVARNVAYSSYNGLASSVANAFECVVRTGSTCCACRAQCI
jgi:hypothetical protein